MFPHFIQSILLAYIDSIEPLVASAHAQMQMKQAIIFVLAIFCCCSKNMCRPVLFCYGCCYAPERSIKYYIETNRVSIKNPTKNQGRTLVLWKDEQFLLRHWHPSCTSKPSDISGMRKVPDCDYDNRNISVVI